MIKINISIDDSSLFDIWEPNSNNFFDSLGREVAIESFTKEFVQEMGKINESKNVATKEHEALFKPFLDAESVHLYWLSNDPVYGMIDFSKQGRESKKIVIGILQKMAKKNEMYEICVKQSV